MHYYFHIRDDRLLVEDRVGIEIPVQTGLEDDLRRAARTVLAEAEWESELRADRRIEVIDETGALILTVPFREAATGDQRQLAALCRSNC